MRSGSWISHSEAETLDLAGEFAGELAPGDNVFLIGELGAGKTTFVRGVVAHLDSDVEVNSPSYTLINAYPTNPPIYHIDLYRTRQASDLSDLGLDEYFDSDGIAMIEWAEKCEQWRPKRLYRVSLTLIKTNERRILIEDLCGDTGS
jgi:tRNA threonylcarbamoyladenosine biosynthesis protein TsaE